MRTITALLTLTLALAFGQGQAVAQPRPVPPGFAAGVRDVAPFDYVCRPRTGPYTAYAGEEAAFLAEFASQGLKATNVQFTVYWNSPLQVKPEALRWEIGFPVAARAKTSGSLLAKRFTYTKVAVAVHHGPYNTTFHTINALYSWIAAQGMRTIGGPCVEHYLDPEPDKVPDARKRTAVWIPVR